MQKSPEADFCRDERATAQCKTARFEPERRALLPCDVRVLLCRRARGEHFGERDAGGKEEADHRPPQLERDKGLRDDVGDVGDEVDHGEDERQHELEAAPYPELRAAASMRPPSG